MWAKPDFIGNKLSNKFAVNSLSTFCIQLNKAIVCKSTTDHCPLWQPAQTVWIFNKIYTFSNWSGLRKLLAARDSSTASDDNRQPRFCCQSDRPKTLHFTGYFRVCGVRANRVTLPWRAEEVSRLWLVALSGSRRQWAKKRGEICKCLCLASCFSLLLFLLRHGFKTYSYIFHKQTTISSAVNWFNPLQTNLLLLTKTVFLCYAWILPFYFLWSPFHEFFALILVRDLLIINICILCLYLCVFTLFICFRVLSIQTTLIVANFRRSMAWETTMHQTGIQKSSSNRNSRIARLNDDYILSDDLNWHQIDVCFTIDFQIVF